jgi:hypothetical protein
MPGIAPSIDAVYGRLERRPRTAVPGTPRRALTVRRNWPVAQEKPRLALRIFGAAATIVNLVCLYGEIFTKKIFIGL